MNSQDFQSFENNRADAIAKLVTFCFDNGLDYSYNDKIFGVKLPEIEELPTATHSYPHKKKFDISDWGPRGIDETNTVDRSVLETTDGPPYAPGEAIPDDFQMPDTGEILEEGEPPKGDTDAEK